jgi:hypothetical protein
MMVLKGVLKESRDYYRQIESEINGRLRRLPKGSIKRRRINRNFYYYLQSRKGPKVVHKYLGKQDPKELQKQLKERRQLENELKKIHESLHLLNKMKKHKRNK